MILQELVRYYERQAENPEPQIAPIGLGWQEISFAIVIDKDGNFVDIEDLRPGDQKSKGRACLVPQARKRSSNIEPQLLWDNLGYVLGCDKKKPAKVHEKHQAFKARIQSFALNCGTNESVSATRKFLETLVLGALQCHPKWEEMESSIGNISFRLEGEQQLVCESPAVHKIAQAEFYPNETPMICCLATGKEDKLMRIHDSIKGVFGKGAQTSGASIVSFNEPAFRSFNKEQGANSPVGIYAATAYTTALNGLLDGHSRQRLQLGETSVVFWCDKSHEVESLLFDLFEEAPKDNPALHTEAVRTLYKSPHTGAMPFDNDQTRFFVLGLGPNAARIAIRFWHASTVAAVASHIRQYFSDVDIVRPKWAPEHPTLISLLLSSALRCERKNIQPSLPSAVLNSILDGTPFPTTLALAVLGRIRAERDVTYHRAAVLKAFLNRQTRIFSGKKEDEMTVALDDSNMNVGYNLGRLFAVLEKIQNEALGDLNASIRDRYYAAASATPVTCFPILMRLKNHHLAKLTITNRGRAINLEKLIGLIVDHIRDFPAHLKLADQGRFAIGYYHQRQSFFNKSESHEANARPNSEHTLVEA
jgi:CRISPR-associated protein Csd1